MTDRRCWIARLALLVVLLPLGPARADVRQLDLPTNDLVYDRLRDRIYASVPSRASAPGQGNSVTVIDPESGTIGASVFVGSEPDKLAISDDQHYLYVALDGAGAVRRVDLTTLVPDLQWSLGSGPNAPYRVDALEVMPGSPETVAVSRSSLSSPGGFVGVLIYDRGVPRPQSLMPRGFGPVSLQFSASPSRLYANSSLNMEFGFRRLSVESDGITVIDPAPAVSGLGPEIFYDAGLLYSDSGRVFDPEAETLVGTFLPPPRGPYPPSFGQTAAIVPDSEVGRAYFMTGDYMTGTLLAYEQQTFLPVGSQPIPGVKGDVGSLRRWGRNGLAFRTDQGQLFLVRTPLIPADELVLTFTPAAVQGGTPATGQIDLRGAAPPGGLSIPLASDQPAVASVPDHVQVDAGATSASFPVRTAAVPSATTVTIFAALRGKAWPSALPVLPRVRFSVALEKASVIGSQATAGTIMLTAPAPPGGVTVALSSDNPTVGVPESVMVPPSATTARFPITTGYVTDKKPASAKITASYGEVNSSADLSVLPVAAISLSLQPDPVVGGTTVTGTVTLNIAAPPEGTTVLLYGFPSAAVTVPPSVTVPGGQTTATFPVTTYPVQSASNVPVGVVEGGDGTATQLTVLPRVTRIFGINFDLNPVIGGVPVTATVTLESVAPPGGVTAALSSSLPGTAHVPASVAIPAGSSSATFLVTTSPVTTRTPVTISATTDGGTQTQTLFVLRAGIIALTISPNSVAGGGSATGTLTLLDPAPGTPGTPGSGVVIDLSSDNELVVGLSKWAVVPGGSRSATFPIRTARVTKVTTVKIVASYAGASSSATLTVQPR